jgi:hypothetical protein
VDVNKIRELAAKMRALANDLEGSVKGADLGSDYESEDVEEKSSDKKSMFIEMMKKKGME